MTRRTLVRAAAPALGLAVAVAAVTPALAGSAAQAPSRVGLEMVGGPRFEPNRFVSDTMRFERDVTRVAPGGRVVLRDRTRNPHTLSLVRRSQLPRTFGQMNGCFEGGPCSKLAVDHGVINPDTGEEQEPTTPLVNVGAAGFNAPGDSIVIAPRGSATIRVTASRGSNRYFLCAIHPWMQGKFEVR
jgi:hypothetical protein